MAIITDWDNIKGSGKDADEAFFVSAEAVPADSVELDGLPALRNHWFLGVELLDGDGLIAPASAGTFAVSIKTWNTGQWEAPPVASIDATAPATIDWAGPTVGVRVVPTGLTGTVTWRVKLSVARS
jgi:hypothetical protein